MPSGPCVWQAVAGAVYVYRVDGAELGEGLERVVAQVATAFQVGPEFNVIKFRTDELKVSFLSYPRFFDAPHLPVASL